MSLINSNSTPTTTEEKQARTKTQLQSLTTLAFRQLRQTYEQGRRLVHANPHGLTAEEVAVGLGEDAAELVRLTDLLVATLNAAVPGTVPTSPPPSDDNPTAEGV